MSQPLGKIKAKREKIINCVFHRGTLLEVDPVATFSQSLSSVVTRMVRGQSRRQTEVVCHRPYRPLIAAREPQRSAFNQFSAARLWQQVAAATAVCRPSGWRVGGQDCIAYERPSRSACTETIGSASRMAASTGS